MFVFETFSLEKLPVHIVNVIIECVVMLTGCEPKSSRSKKSDSGCLEGDRAGSLQSPKLTLCSLISVIPSSSMLEEPNPPSYLTLQVILLILNVNIFYVLKIGVEFTYLSLFSVPELA